MRYILRGANILGLERETSKGVSPPARRYEAGFFNATQCGTVILRGTHEKGEAHALRIAKTFGFGLNQTQRQLRRLEESWVLTSRKVGTVRLYAFNHRNPTVENLVEFLGTEICEWY